jgi:MFS family permease
MQVPLNLILGKIKYPAVYICSAMALWGVISACMGAVQGFGGLVAARFCVGVIEAVFFPGALFYMSLYYTRASMLSAPLLSTRDLNLGMLSEACSPSLS